MSRIRLDRVSKSFDEVPALSNVSLDIRDGEFFVLLGPTGAGKTTCLRVIAGLERQEEGRVLFDEFVMDGTPPADRDTAFVFQQYSLYPNMSVRENLAFPLRSPLRRLNPAEIEARIAEAAAKLHIDHLLERKTARLSGGEMQRVSIGRAIVRQPRVFLMDEPLSNLDAKLRESLRIELGRLQRSQGITTVFVTHDQIEALTMADRLAVLQRGRIVQSGTPEDIYDRPATTFVAQLVGTPRINLLPAACENGALRVGGGLEFQPAELPELPPSLQLGIRPEDVRIHPDGAFRAQVALTEPLGVETVVHLRMDDTSLLAVTPGTTLYDIGAALRFDVDPDRLHYFRDDGTRFERAGS